MVEDRSAASPRFSTTGVDRMRSRSEESLLEPRSSVLIGDKLLSYHTSDRRSTSSKLVSEGSESMSQVTKQLYILQLYFTRVCWEFTSN